MLENHINQFFKNIHNKLNIIDKNFNHTAEAIKTYVATTKKEKHVTSRIQVVSDVNSILQQRTTKTTVKQIAKKENDNDQN